MRVIIAYPWTGPDGVEHAGGDTVDVPDAVGRQLLRDGKARFADAERLGLTTDQATALATSYFGIPDAGHAGTSLDLDDPPAPGTPVIPTAAPYPGPTPPKE